jgi:hypothetical protein
MEPLLLLIRHGRAKHPFEEENCFLVVKLARGQAEELPRIDADYRGNLFHPMKGELGFSAQNHLEERACQKASGRGRHRHFCDPLLEVSYEVNGTVSH